MVHVGGTHHLSCWQRQPLRCAKHVKYWFLIQKYSKFSFLYFNIHRGDNTSKHLEWLFLAKKTAILFWMYVLYKNVLWIKVSTTATYSHNVDFTESRIFVLCEKKTTRIISVAGIHTIGCLLHVLTAQQLLHEVNYCRRYMLNKLCWKKRHELVF